MIEQVKARPGNSKTWSLKDILGEVIPDLYLGGLGQSGPTQYHFVTEGVRGDWEPAERFFKKLGESPVSSVNTASDLDGSMVLYRPKATGQFWKLPTYTERQLYEFVVDLIQQKMARRKGAACEERAETFLKLQLVLGGFEFRGERTDSFLEREIDRTLLRFVDHREDVASVRARMLEDLSRRATARMTFTSEDFFREHGLKSIDLHNWTALMDQARVALTSNHRACSYESASDVRPKDAVDAQENWPTDRSVMLIYGESGQGKSWLANAILSMTMARCSELSAVVSAGPDTDSTISKAARRVWADIAGRIANHSLGQISSQIREVLAKPRCRWLTLLIDDVQDVGLARELAQQPWAAWGVRLVITSPTRVADRVLTDSGGEIYPVSVSDFTDAQLRQFLRAVVGDKWALIPEDIRQPLKRPIIAESFRKVVHGSGDMTWTASIEYEVFQRLWGRLEDAHGVQSLVPLIRQVLEGCPYPWDGAQLERAGVDASGVEVLTQARWLQPVEGGARYEVPHDRLLNWALAEVIVMNLRQDPFKAGDIGRRFRDILFHEAKLGEFYPGYAPMDALWIASGTPDLLSVTCDLLAAMEADAHDGHTLYERLVPTLGGRIVPALLDRRKRTEHGSATAILVQKSIVAIGGKEAENAGLNLICTEDPELQMSGVGILRQTPTTDAIAKLWDLFRRAKSAEDSPYVRHNMFEALRACVRLNPNWLDGMLSATDLNADYIPDLLWLLVGLPIEAGSPVWNRHKSRLFRSELSDDGRSLAYCLGRFRASGRIPWLIRRLSNSDAWVSRSAIQALSILSPGLAIANLDRVPTIELYAALNLYADRLFCYDAAKMQSRLRGLFSKADNPWSIAEVYNGREHWVDAETIALFIERLDRDLRRELQREDPNPSEGRLRLALCQVVRFRTPEALKQFPQGSSRQLGSRLVRYLKFIGPGRGSRSADGTSRYEALEVLRRIDGAKFTKAVNYMLAESDHLDLLRAIDFASRRGSPSTIRRLRELATTEQESDWSSTIRGAAAKGLLDFREWRPVIDFLEEVGLNSSPDLMRWPQGGIRPSEKILAPVRKRVRDCPTPGAVLALGFGRSEANSATVRSVLKGEPPESNVAHAAVLALQMMGDRSEDAVNAIAELYTCDRTRSVTNALLANGTRKALVALRNSPVSGDRTVRLNLINKLEETSSLDKCIEWLTERAKNQEYGQLPSDLEYLLRRIRSKEAKHRILAVPELVELCEEIAYFSPASHWRSSRLDAVWYLIQASPKKGKQAALNALDIDEASDRYWYPHFLVETFGREIVSDLLDHLKSEPDSVVKAAVGRALLSVDMETHLEERLDSVDASDRIAACIASGWASRSEGIAVRLKDCLANDAEPKVQQSAGQALSRINVRHRTAELAQMVIDSEDHFDRWLYLDALIEFADPGDGCCQWPADGPLVGDCLSPLQTMHLRKRLKDRQKKEMDEQRRKDRQSRD